jgi:hypothetical protein
MKKRLVLIIGSVAFLAALNASAGGFCFTNTLFWPTHPKMKYQFVAPVPCGTGVTNGYPTALDGVTCSAPTGNPCDRLSATHLYVSLHADTNRVRLLGVMTWVNAATGKTNAFVLYLLPGETDMEYELQADVAPCASSLLSWKTCGGIIGRPNEKQPAIESE